MGVDRAYDKGIQVIARLLGPNLSELAVETAVAEQSRFVEAYYEQKEPFPATEEGPILAAQADGKGVPMVCQEEEKATTLSPTSRAAQTLHRIANYLRRNRPYMDWV